MQLTQIDGKAMWHHSLNICCLLYWLLVEFFNGMLQEPVHLGEVCSSGTFFPLDTA